MNILFTATPAIERNGSFKYTSPIPKEYGDDVPLSKETKDTKANKRLL
jgi:hypothetical protein